MSQQAQIDALEHLVLTLIRKNRTSISTTDLIEDAKASVLSEKNASGTSEKSEAVAYLDHLKVVWPL